MAGIGNMIFYMHHVQGTAALRRFLSTTILVAVAAAGVFGEPVPDRIDVPEIIGKYVTALAAQQNAQKGMSSEVTFTASLPKLKKSGRMELLRKISPGGEINYKQLHFEGDDTIKKEVIARFLTAEKKAKEDSNNLAVIPLNYHFKFKGLGVRDDRQVYVFEVKPRDKRIGLFKGELWIDPDTYLPVHEEGRMVKNPSMFFKKVDFSRDYAIAEGVARMNRISSVIDTRIAGRAEIEIKYNNYQPMETVVDAAKAEHDTAKAEH
jgi:hypothetical protein